MSMLQGSLRETLYACSLKSYGKNDYFVVLIFSGVSVFEYFATKFYSFYLLSVKVKGYPLVVHNSQPRAGLTCFLILCLCFLVSLLIVFTTSKSLEGISSS